LQFIPSKYKLSKEQFGELLNGLLLDSSLILSQMVKDSKGNSVKILSKFKSSKEQFGKLVGNSQQTLPWLDSSLILNEDERLSLSQMVKVSDGNLLYRASRDGFTASAFHSKCDGKANTVTIIKTNSNYVFGGYTAAKWGANNDYTQVDSSAFLFSLRRNGTSNNHKFQIIKAESAIFGWSVYGPTFGGGFDIYIKDRSNIHAGSYSNLGNSYQCPTGYSHGNKNTKCFLAGTYDGWLTTEIEIHQLC
jgi:hypothetical protein